MYKRIVTYFRREDEAAVTVDFVVLTAGIALIGTLIVSTVGNGLTHLSSGVDTTLSQTPG